MAAGAALLSVLRRGRKLYLVGPPGLVIEPRHAGDHQQSGGPLGGLTGDGDQQTVTQLGAAAGADAGRLRRRPGSTFASPRIGFVLCFGDVGAALKSLSTPLGGAYGRVSPR
jgi:hypothetical protein